MSADLSMYFPTQADIPTQWRLTAPVSYTHLTLPTKA